MAFVGFSRTKTLAEALASVDTDTIFFPTDSTSIVMGGKEYAQGSKKIKLSLSQYRALREAGLLDADTVYMIINIDADAESIDV